MSRTSFWAYCRVQRTQQHAKDASPPRKRVHVLHEHNENASNAPAGDDDNENVVSGETDSEGSNSLHLEYLVDLDLHTFPTIFEPYILTPPPSPVILPVDSAYLVPPTPYRVPISFTDAGRGIGITDCDAIRWREAVEEAAVEISAEEEVVEGEVATEEAVSGSPNTSSPELDTGDCTSQQTFYHPAPTQPEAQKALQDIRNLLHPFRVNGIGHKDPKLSLWVRDHLQAMKIILGHYTTPTAADYDHWEAASYRTATGLGKGTGFAKRLRKRTREYILDRDCIPTSTFGEWCTSLLDDEEFKAELQLHLMTIGKYVQAMDIVRYMNQDDFKAKWNSGIAGSAIIKASTLMATSARMWCIIVHISSFLPGRR